MINPPIRLQLSTHELTSKCTCKNFHFSLALVTGASSGIGEAFCRLLAAKGIPLLITGRDKSRIEALANELSEVVSVITVIADLAETAGREKLIEQIHLHKPDLVVNNAGFGLYGNALTHETVAQIEIVNVNVIALLELTLESARVLKNAGRGGVIMNISSAADFLVFPSLAVYSATKAFVTQFSRSLDNEMRPDGIAVLVACPGVVNTKFRSHASGEKIHSTGYWALSAESAAEELWWQIESLTPVHVFDWKTRWGRVLTHFIPIKWLSRILARAISIP